MQQAEVFSVPPHWRRIWLSLAVVLVATILLYRDTAIAMVGIWWRSETFTHCFLVPPIVLWLVWRRRDDLHALTPRPHVPTIFVVLGMGFAWLLGDLAAVNALTQFALVAMLMLSVPALLGLDAARVILFPLAFSFFAVPAGEFLMPQFMDWTADFTIWALRLTGIPVYREGLQFVIPSGRWSVVEACSGIRYLIASLTVGTLYAYLNYQSNRRRVAFMGVALLIPIIANWLRAYMIVMLGHVSGNTLAVGVDHLIYGWLFFGVVILLMFFVGARWAEPDGVGLARSTSSVGSMSAAQRGRVAAVSVGLIVAMALPTGVHWWLSRGGVASVVDWSFPLSFNGGWKRVESVAPPLAPIFENALRESNATYERDGKRVGLYVAYYRQQSFASKLISSTNAIVRSGSREWTATEVGTRSLEVGHNPIGFRSTRLRALPIDNHDPSAGLLVWQVYWVSGMWTSSDHLAKAYGALSRLLGRGDDSAVVVIYSAQRRDMNAEAVMGNFVRDQFAGIEDGLRRAQAGP